MRNITSSGYPPHPILVVEDEKSILVGYQEALTHNGVSNLICLMDSREALKIIKRKPLNLVLLDLHMPFVTGEKILAETIHLQPRVPVIVVTGENSIESAVRCIKEGAYDYLVKPVSTKRVVTAVKNALRVRELQEENLRLSERIFSPGLQHPEYFTEIVTADPMMLAIYQYIEAVAPTSNPVLLTGETGVGKELMARAIHKASRRSGKFVAVNIAGLDDTMFSDALFGHIKGAYTGAYANRQGFIAQAARGTLFLDEIGELAVTSQVKLLRLLQEQEYMPLGQDQPIRTDARIVVATNVDLAKQQEAGKFRPDLYYRLSTHRIHIPPLRKRRGDLVLLVDHFLESAARRLNKKKPTAPRELVALLSTYDFPGNVRELEAMITDAVSRHTAHMLSLKSFKDYLDARSDAQPMFDKPDDTKPIEPADHLFGEQLPPFKHVKRLLVEEALRRARGNRTRAAELLGTSRQALSWHLQHPESD